jgi:Transposase DDE domain group 1
MGERIEGHEQSSEETITLDTFGGKVHVEWDPQGAVSPLGQLPFFIEFLKVSGLYDHFIETCPLQYSSPNAPSVRDVLGTLLLSILAGHHRYAHISTIRFDGVNPGLLGMEKVVSEDAARRAMKAIEEDAGVSWLDGQLRLSTEAAIAAGSWILDTDTTVKCLYGKQEGAVVSYNPTKRGRPSHNYHSCFMANTRLALCVEVNQGNEHTAHHVMPSLWNYYDSLSPERMPALIRGDIFLGNEGFIVAAESRSAHYLTKLRLTANVKRLIERLFFSAIWVDAGHGYEGAESELRLDGWTRSRRVIVTRRLIQDNIVLTDDKQLNFVFIDTSETARRYEYAVLLTDLSYDIHAIAQLYRDRADAENCFDELKNQWGWGGYTTQDLKRCRLISRMVALVYNWWSLFVRLAAGKHHEAITSRPLLLYGVARQTKHAGQTTLTITNNHAQSSAVVAVLQELNKFLKYLKVNAEQLQVAQRMGLIVKRAFQNLLAKSGSPPLLPAPI